MSWAYWLQYLPLAFNFVLCVASLWEGQLGKGLYWGGATILTVGVILMEG